MMMMNKPCPVCGHNAVFLSKNFYQCAYREKNRKCKPIKARDSIFWREKEAKDGG